MKQFKTFILVILTVKRERTRNREMKTYAIDQ